MSEWKELDIANLPPDILVGDYEFEYYSIILEGWRNSAPQGIKEDKFTWVISLLNDSRDCSYRFRKRAPKAPTHEEIMTKWWEIAEDIWQKVDTYNKSDSSIIGVPIYVFNGEADEANRYNEKYARSFVSKDWFTGRESSDIPPEAK